MSAVTVLQTAVSLAKQGVHQDKAKNYPEAARCYRESVAAFSSIRHKSANEVVAKAIDQKIEQYRDRLRVIDKYLLSKADLSGVLKSVVDYHHGVPVPDDALQRSLQIIDRAKRRDGRGHHQESLGLYEEGMTGLLEAAELASDQNASEKIRFKCLLIHERVEAIRNFIETGSDALGSPSIDVDAIDGDSSGCSSPEPLMPVAESETEEHAMLMTPFQSESNLVGLEPVESRHSLYPMCEIRRPASMASVNSDFLGSAGSGAESSPIPLANMDRELAISTDNVYRSRMMGVHSADLSPAGSETLLRRYRSLHTSAEDVLSPLAITAASDSGSFTYDDKDCNISELTYDPRFLKCSSPDRSSDSGISDPSKPESTTPANTPKKRSVLSLNDIHPGATHPRQVRARSLTPTVGIRIPQKTPSKKSLSRDGSSGCRNHTDSTDKLTVVSSDVVDHKPNVEGCSFHGNAAESVPPRSTARSEDNEISEGCFVFLSCLDAFGIL